MVTFYLMKIKAGTITAASVPARWRAAVEAELNK